ncbi:MAG: hypothetical protein M5R36_06180 [Deltaproteobacteria bacterium]|nr:hypothetical protein [Deltaproteobacteria bacterium]
MNYQAANTGRLNGLGNSAFIKNGSVRIQAPRFQPGAVHAANGLSRAKEALKSIGTDRAVAVESFPQLSILPLIEYSLRNEIPISRISNLKAHKQSGESATQAARQLVGAFKSWTGFSVAGNAEDGQPDAVDALLALFAGDSSAGSRERGLRIIFRGTLLVTFKACEQPAAPVNGQENTQGRNKGKMDEPIEARYDRRFWRTHGWNSFIKITGLARTGGCRANTIRSIVSAVISRYWRYQAFRHEQ